MYLNKEILRSSDYPIYRNNFIICFNFERDNEVWNLPVRHFKDFKNDKDAVGVWKPKQLKQ